MMTFEDLKKEMAELIQAEPRNLSNIHDTSYQVLSDAINKLLCANLDSEMRVRVAVDVIVSAIRNNKIVIVRLVANFLGKDHIDDRVSLAMETGNGGHKGNAMFYAKLHRNDVAVQILLAAGSKGD
jgi:hypothetical protein